MLFSAFPCHESTRVGHKERGSVDLTVTMASRPSTRMRPSDWSASNHVMFLSMSSMRACEHHMHALIFGVRGQRVAGTVMSDVRATSHQEQYRFCTVCRRNHDEGRKHIFTKTHKRRLDYILGKFSKKV